jgi:hypothetical protein
LTGTLPGTISDLKFLTMLDLSGNNGLDISSVPTLGLTSLQYVVNCLLCWVLCLSARLLRDLPLYVRKHLRCVW